MAISIPELPPGILIYNKFEMLASSYPVLGYPVILLVCAIINGVIYGAIIWLIFTIFKYIYTIKRQKIDIKDILLYHLHRKKMKKHSTKVNSQILINLN